MNVSVQLNYSHGYFINYGLILGKPNHGYFYNQHSHRLVHTCRTSPPLNLFVFVIAVKWKAINSYRLQVFDICYQNVKGVGRGEDLYGSDSIVGLKIVSNPNTSIKFEDFWGLWNDFQTHRILCLSYYLTQTNKTKEPDYIYQTHGNP